jgi:hypothetical protein
LRSRLPHMVWGRAFRALSRETGLQTRWAVRALSHERPPCIPDGHPGSPMSPLAKCVGHRVPPLTSVLAAPKPLELLLLRSRSDGRRKMVQARDQ